MIFFVTLDEEEVLLYCVTDRQTDSSLIIILYIIDYLQNRKGNSRQDIKIIINYFVHK